MKIIEKIDEILKQKGISQYKLSKETGIKQTTISSWKKGAEPSAEKILAIIRYFGISPNEFFEYQNQIILDEEHINQDHHNKQHNNLTENEIELLDLFRQLPERQQIKEIGIFEQRIKDYRNSQIENQQKSIYLGNELKQA